MKRLIFTFILFGLLNSLNVAKAQQINPKIQEVFLDKTQELVINDQARHDFLNDLLINRVKIIESALGTDEKYPLLSSVALLNKYNPSLTRDSNFNPETFNPLKYDLVFSAKTPIVYRVDNTNYLIVIEPQKINVD
jgi:hypothetical protein